MILKRTLAWGLFALLLVSVVPAANAQDDGPTIDLELVVDGLTSPLGLMPAGDGSGRLFVFEQTGQIWVLDENGERLDEPFLDLTGRMVELNDSYDERGLLGLAFHPDYAENGRFFVYYSAPLSEDAPAEWNHTSHISEFRVSAEDANLADPNSERIILTVDQPQGNHDGGQIAFGPDGYLYIPLGDGGSANDVAEGHTPDLGNAQDTSNLLGSILRIDIDGAEPYHIPADNPFSGDQGEEEIFAYGFRNPYRMSFDAGGDNQLFVGDAGQNQWEEVSIVTLGSNYGWNIKEGTHCFDPDNPDQMIEQCPDTGLLGNNLIDPIIEYRNANAEGGIGLVVVGGNVYRGSEMPEFEGRYLFGDWSTSWQVPDGTLFLATPSDVEGELWSMEELRIASRENGRLGSYLLSFGQDADLELYVMTTDTAGPSGDTGAVYKIVPADTEMMEDPDEGVGEDAVEGMAREMVTPAVEASDQSIEDGTVTVAQVVSNGPGWIVIHADESGAPGPVLGYTAVSDGENPDVVVDIDTELATETLYAMLHTDAGTEGAYEFPGDDTPVQVEGEVVVEAFTVTDMAAAQPEVTATAEPTVTVTPTVGVDEEEPTTLPVTGGPTMPWTAIMLVAGGLAALTGGAYLLRERETEDVRIEK